MHSWMSFGGAHSLSATNRKNEAREEGGRLLTQIFRFMAGSAAYWSLHASDGYASTRTSGQGTPILSGPTQTEGRAPTRSRRLSVIPVRAAWRRVCSLVIVHVTHPRYCDVATAKGAPRGAAGARIPVDSALSGDTML
jgi:hypothetical protein